MADMMKDYIVVFITAPSKKEAEYIADKLVAKKLAACVNILPGLLSIYTWQGNTEKAMETLLVIKTKKAFFANLEAEVKRLHSYDVPEIIALPITIGSKSYLDWIGKNTK